MTQSIVRSSVPRAAIEFVVIVVGVLAALAVDQWRETSSEETLRTEYVAGLIEDIELELSYIDLLENLGRDRIASADRVLLFLGHDAGQSIATLGYEAPSDIVRSRLAEDVVSASQLQFLVPEAIVWQDLIETGNLRILDNLELRRRVSRYYSQIRFQSRDLEYLLRRFSMLEKYLLNAGISTTNPASIEAHAGELRALPELAAFVSNARDTQAEVLLRHSQLRSWADSALVELRR